MQVKTNFTVVFFRIANYILNLYILVGGLLVNSSLVLHFKIRSFENFYGFILNLYM